jgi:transposase InsO family protein
MPMKILSRRAVLLDRPVENKTARQSPREESLRAIAVGAPTASRSVATMARKCGSDCCDREAMSLLATPAGIDVRVLMVAAIEHRFGMAHRLPVTIEWLSDNGSCYVASDTRSFARDISLEPRTTPIESPQSNGNGRSLRAHHLNEIHPHKALGYHSPCEFISARGSP